ncbi:MAG: energy-coupled thiamine transporter ThiT [Clostridia bacterium]|nr:energy-coupled thiamine transporter ThiT [Clostridia bacterium]
MTKSKNSITIRKFVESALFIALATVLSLIKIDLPFGGGVTVVSMLPIVFCSHRWGWKWGVATAFVYSALQLVLGLDNVSYVTSAVMVFGVIFLDYIIAYTFIGLSGIFGNTRKAVFFGILLSFTLRFLCHLITGAWIWGEWMPEEFMNMTMTNVWFYSFLYNGWYMLFEIIFTEIVAMLIYKPLGKYFRREDIR